MPVEVATAAVIATGYKGPISLEVFNNSLSEPGDDIPTSHAKRGMTGLQKLAEAARTLTPFWNTPAQMPMDTVAHITNGVRARTSRL